MAGFVNQEIGEIDEEEIGGVGVSVDEEESVENEPGDGGEARGGFPFAEVFVEPVHGDRVAAVGRGRRDSFWIVGL